MPLYEHLNTSDNRWIRDLLVLTALLGCLLFIGLGSAPLIDPDEGRYAEIPREMLEKGDFVTPTLNYVKYFEKPPLLYWLNAASMTVFGHNEFAARVPSALSGLVTILLVYAIGRRLYDRRTGLLAALILGSSTGFLLLSRIILTDMLLTCCLSTALFAFLLAVQTTGIYRRRWFYLFFAACGLSVLAKGLIGIVLPGGILFWYLLLSRQWRILREIPWIGGLVVLLAVCAPWFILVSRQNPEFAQFFFIHEHFQRFTSKVHGRYQPAWYFVPIILVSLFPWSLSIPATLLRNIASWHGKGNTTTHFLVIWPVIIFTFFSLSSSKLAPYMLPIYPPLAILIAHRYSDILKTGPQRLTPLTGLIAALIVPLGVSFAAYDLLASARQLFATFVPSEAVLALQNGNSLLPQHFLAYVGAALAIEGCLLIVLTMQKKPVRLPAVVTIAIVGITLYVAVHTAYTVAIAPQLSSKQFAAIIRSRLQPGDRIAALGYDQGINYYTGKRVIVVLDKGELAFGSQQGPHSDWFITPEQFFSLWHSKQRVFATMDKIVLHLYPSLFMQHQILAARGNKVLLLNTP